MSDAKSDDVIALEDERIRVAYEAGVVDIDLKDRAMFGGVAERKLARAEVAAILNGAGRR